MSVFAVGFVVLPLLALVAGTIMALAGTPEGIVVAVMGAVGVIIEQFGRALRRRAGDSAGD